MKAIIQKVGPRRAQVYVKGLSPPFILVPVEVLPTAEEGEEMELVFVSRPGVGIGGHEVVLPQTFTSSSKAEIHRNVPGIRRSY